MNASIIAANVKNTPQGVTFLRGLVSRKLGTFTQTLGFKPGDFKLPA